MRFTFKPQFERDTRKEVGTALAVSSYGMKGPCSLKHGSAEGTTFFDHFSIEQRILQHNGKGNYLQLTLWPFL